MLRPSNSLLGSSRAARRANLNAERRKWVWQFVRTLAAVVVELAAIAVDLVVLCGLPLVYLAASYLVLDLPARWITHRAAADSWHLLLFAGALVVSIVALARLFQDAPPIAPVRPKFAKTMLALGWIAAFLLTVGDLAS
jgi:hypothetical protein